MPGTSILEQLRTGKRVQVMAFGALASPKLVEIAGTYPQLAGIWIDQEHSAITPSQLELLLIACRAAGLDAFARVAPTDYATIMRPYEAGCSGVMVAQIRSLEQVQQVVQWAHYPPHGMRGLFLGNAESGYSSMTPAQQVAAAGKNRWLSIQIETREAVEQVSEIAAHEGVDWLFVGPGDLACTLGVPGDVMHPDCQDAVRRVADACRSAGKPWGTLSRSVEHAEFCLRLGCQLMSVYGDLDIVRHGFQALEARFAPIIESF